MSDAQLTWPEQSQNDALRCMVEAAKERYGELPHGFELVAAQGGIEVIGEIETFGRKSQMRRFSVRIWVRMPSGVESPDYIPVETTVYQLVSV